MRLVGLVTFLDPIKTTAKATITEAKNLGVAVKIFSGDSREVVGAVAYVAGLITDPKDVITGSEFEALPLTEQITAVETKYAFARFSPTQKFAALQLLQKSHTVGFLSEGNDELQGYVPQGKEPGWLVPSELRDRWELTLGDSNVELKKVVGKLDSIDLFYHDSEHSYETMMFEFTETWDKIRKEGYLLADDIRWNDSWKDFLAKHQGTYSFMYRNFGILRK
jgi:hypothetical protein